METMKKLLIFIAMGAILLSCSDPFGVEDNVRITPITKPKKLNLSNIELGAQAKFTFFEISDGSYLSSDNKKPFTGDTLVLEVYGKNKEGWQFREYIIKQENLIDNILRSDLLSDTLQDTVAYIVNIIYNEFIAEMPGSDFFNSYFFKSSGNVRFLLDNYTDTLVSMNMWVSPFTFSQIFNKGYMVNFEHKQKINDLLNIIEMGDNSKVIASEIPLQLQIFSKKYGFVQRIMFYKVQNIRQSIGYGWDLVE
jgi:hypothetical protein